MAIFTDSEITITNVSDASNILGFTVNNAPGVSTMLTTSASAYREVDLGDVTGTAVVYENSTESVYIGSTSNPNAVVASIYCSSATTGKGALQLNQYVDDTSTPGVQGFKSRSGSIGVNSPVQSADGLIQLVGQAVTDNLNIMESGRLRCEVVNVPSSSSYVGTNWTLYNTARNGPSMKSAFQIDSEGIIRTRGSAANIGLDYPSQGVVTLANSGEFTVSHGTIPSNARILVTAQPGQAPTGQLWISAVTVNTSFVITSTAGAADNGVVVFYQIFAPLS